MWSDETKRLDLEADWTHQRIDETKKGRSENDFDQVRYGLRMRWNPMAEEHWTARIGFAWVRHQGESSYLDRRGDYGGGAIRVERTGCWLHVTISQF